MKMNNSITKVREKNKKDLTAKAEKLIARVNSSGLRHCHIAEEILVSEETFSRFMSMKDGYMTKRIVDALDEFLTNKNK